MSTDLANLEYTADEMRRMGYATVERLVDHVLGLETQPARGDVDAAELCRRLREPPPEQGVAYEPLLDRLLAEWAPRSFTSSGPGYLAYVPGGGLYPAGLADLIAGVVNRYTGVRLAAPALEQLESNALDWLRDWMAFPAQARGLFTTGGSMANFNAVLCARERHLGAEIRPGVLYGSTQMHHSMIKSARLAGIMPDRVRAVRVDERFRMDVGALADAIAADRRAGLRPFCVASAAGTTNTGAVDPLNAVADLCAREGDLAPRGRRLRGVLPHVPGASASHARAFARRFPHARIRTRACSCRTAPGPCSCATALRCAGRTRRPQATCRAGPMATSSTTLISMDRISRAGSRAFASGSAGSCTAQAGSGPPWKRSGPSPWRRRRAWPRSRGS